MLQRIVSQDSFHKKWAIVLLGAVVLFIFYQWISTYDEAGFRNPDAFDYAQMGSELLAGNGFSTRQLLPRHIPYLHARGLLEGETIPNLYRYPGPIVAHAFFQLFIDDLEKAGTAQSGIFFVMALLVLFLGARHIVGTKLAVLCVLLMLSLPEFRRTTQDGLSEALAMPFIFAIAFWSLRPKLRLGSLFGIGVLCGLAMLIRNQLVYLLPLAMVARFALASGRGRLTSVGPIAAGWLVTVLPWFIRNIQLTGSPAFSFSSNRNLVLGIGNKKKDLELILDAPATTGQVWEHYSQQIINKVADHLWPGLVNPVAWTQDLTMGFLVIFLIVSVLWAAYRRPQQFWQERLFQVAVIALVLANFIIVSLAFYKPRFFFILYPLIILAVLQQVHLFFIKQKKAYGQWIIAALLVVAAGLAMMNFHSLRGTPARPDAQVVQYLNTHATADTVVVATFSFRLALETPVLTIRYPSKARDLLGPIQKYLDVDYLYFRPKPRQERRFEKFIKLSQTPQFQKHFKLIKKFRHRGLLFASVK